MAAHTLRFHVSGMQSFDELDQMGAQLVAHWTNWDQKASIECWAKRGEAYLTLDKEQKQVHPTWSGTAEVTL